MKVRLTECNKSFVETLAEEDRAKVIVTNDTIESSDETMPDKLLAYYKANLTKMGDEIRALTAKLRVEHPEYFE